MAKVYLTDDAREYARCLRLIKGYMTTVTALANELNIDRSSLSRKLRGEVPLTLQEYLKIKKVLEIEEGI